MKKMMNYLLIPAMPTPNGRLHLGHIGGEFLKLDILKRSYQRRGDKAILLCGLDVYDNAVSVTAYQENKNEKQICQEYHAGIKSDLDSLNISYDDFVNWTENKWHDIFQATHHELDEQLETSKITAYETIPFNERSDLPVVGRWLKGECPFCNKDMFGYSCDPCSLYFSPDKIKNPSSIKGDKLEWKKVDNEFIKIPTALIKGYLKEINLQDKVRVILEKVLTGEFYQTRWTTFDRWGLSTSRNGQVFYNGSFSLVELVIFGEIAKKKLNLQNNPFIKNSKEVTTVMAYGMDCSSILLVDIPSLVLARAIVKSCVWRKLFIKRRPVLVAH
jgi:methionyl-tRNA synthetase